MNLNVPFGTSTYNELIDEVMVGIHKLEGDAPLLSCVLEMINQIERRVEQFEIDHPDLTVNDADASDEDASDNDSEYGDPPNIRSEKSKGNLKKIVRQCLRVFY